MLKKNRASSADLRGHEDDEDGLGSGLFDRYSNARRSVVVSKRDRSGGEEDTRSLAADLAGGGGGPGERKKSDWRSRLASKFKRPGETDCCCCCYCCCYCCCCCCCYSCSCYCYAFVVLGFLCIFEQVRVLFATKRLFTMYTLENETIDAGVSWETE